VAKICSAAAKIKAALRLAALGLDFGPRFACWTPTPESTEKSESSECSFASRALKLGMPFIENLLLSSIQHVQRRDVAERRMQPSSVVVLDVAVDLIV
jgi:hypothetical protein